MRATAPLHTALLQRLRRFSNERVVFLLGRLRGDRGLCELVRILRASSTKPLPRQPQLLPRWRERPVPGKTFSPNQGHLPLPVVAFRIPSGESLVNPFA